MSTERTLINVCVDLSESFCTDSGSFSCGTTPSERAAAASIASRCQHFIYTCDLHTTASDEFISNGGLFPPHHLFLAKDAASVPGSCPLPVPEVRAAIAGRSSYCIAPRSVFFATGGAAAACKPDFHIADVEQLFGCPFSSAEDLAKRLREPGARLAVYSGKVAFNGVFAYSVASVRGVDDAGVPKTDDNAFTAVRAAYGLGEGVKFVVTGCVLSICVYQAASNLKQMFPKAEVVVVENACTSLPDKDGVKWGDVVKTMCTQIGVDYVKEF